MTDQKIKFDFLRDFPGLISEEFEIDMEKATAICKLMLNVMKSNLSGLIPITLNRIGVLYAFACPPRIFPQKRNRDYDHTQSDLTQGKWKIGIVNAPTLNYKMLQVWGEPVEEDKRRFPHKNCYQHAYIRNKIYKEKNGVWPPGTNKVYEIKNGQREEDDNYDYYEDEDER
jgi:hypothetical protein